MKKILAVSTFALLGVIALSSCKKDRTCTCTINGDNATSYTIEDMTRSEAKTECDSGDVTVFGIVIECNLN